MAYMVPADQVLALSALEQEITRRSKHVRCNLDVCPELMSAFLILIPHEDKVDVITPFNILVIGGWRILIPHEDKVDVISPINILF